MPAYLLTWNPEPGESVWIQDSIDEIESEGHADITWSTRSSLPTDGSKLFLIRQGPKGRGIIGVGKAISDTFLDENWDEDSESSRARYIEFRVENLVDVENGQAQLLSTEIINDLLPDVQTGAQSSGNVIREDLATALEILIDGGSTNTKRLPSPDFEFEKSDVLEAMQWYRDHGLPPTFSESTDYDVLDDSGRRYPPKVIASLASRRHLGRMVFSNELRGGRGTRAFSWLEKCGFKIAAKGSRKDWLEFTVNGKYTRQDIQRKLGLKETKGGNWYTGHHRHGDNVFLFPTIGEAGRTGHDYKNKWIGEDLQWQTKGDLTQRSPSVKQILSPANGGRVYVFGRSTNRGPFTFFGIGSPKKVHGTKPVTIIWEFVDPSESHDAVYPDEVREPKKYREGALKKVVVLAYERKRAARMRCIQEHGCKCSVCKMAFPDMYGDIGEGFIHVHHLKPLSEIGEEYELDPIKDLRPVCPNCHAMLHKGNPPLSIERLKALIKSH